MKSIIRLLLISLSIVCVGSLSAGITTLPLQQAQEIKAYVQAAKQLGYTNAQIVSEFENAAQLLEKNNGVLALSLKYDERVVWSAIGVLSIATVIATIWLVHYLLKDEPKNQQPGKQRGDGQRPGGEFEQQDEHATQRGDTVINLDAVDGERNLG